MKQFFQNYREHVFVHRWCVGRVPKQRKAYVWKKIIQTGACFAIVLLGVCSSISASADESKLETINDFSRVAQIQGYLRSAEEVVSAAPDSLSQHRHRALAQLAPIAPLYNDLSQRLNWSPEFLISLYTLKDRLSIEAFAQKKWVVDQQHRVAQQLDARIAPSPQSLPLPMQLRVVEQQLLRVDQAYRSAVANHKVVDQASFDRARGALLAVQDRWIEPIRDLLRKADPLIADQIQSALVKITAALPATPSDNMTDADAIDKAIADFVEASRRLVG